MKGSVGIVAGLTVRCVSPAPRRLLNNESGDCLTGRAPAPVRRPGAGISKVERFGKADQMALTANQRLKVRKALHRAYSSAELPIPWAKADVDTAIEEADTWQAAAASSYNSALSNPFKSAASGTDKSVLLAAVIFAEHLVGNPSHIDALHSIVAELNTISEA